MQLVGTAELRLFITPAELRQLADQFERDAKTCKPGGNLPQVTYHVAGAPATRLAIVCPQEAVNDIWQANKSTG